MNKDNVKMAFWILFDILIAAAAVNLVFFVMPALAQWKDSFTPARMITVTAEGKTTATPDLAELSFSVVSQGKNPADLASNNSEKMNAVIEFVKGQGIASSDIATTAYDLSPDYKYDATADRNYITGYTLTQTVSVKVRDLTKVADVIGGLTPLGVNQIGGVNFTLSDQEKFLAVARADAMAKAEAKADAMAADAGVSLGAVENIREDAIMPVFAPSIMASGAGIMNAAVAAPTIEPGTQEVTDNVTITYEIK